MPNVVRIGDDTDHGGKVLTGSSSVMVNGRGAARKGDRVSCPLHGENDIVEGSSTMLDHGRSIALDGHHSACGSRLIASLSGSHVVVR